MKLKTVGALFGAAALAVSMTACSTANDTQTKDTGGDTIELISKKDIFEFGEIFMCDEDIIIQIDKQDNGIEKNNIHRYINKEGVWALYGKKTEGVWECLNVGKSKDVGKEILFDLGCLYCIVFSDLDYSDDVTAQYINQFRKYCGFRYKKNQVREYLYSYIAKEYYALKFISIGDKSDSKKEKKYAEDNEAKFWRNGRPFTHI